MNEQLTDEQKQSLYDQWSYHIDRCEECRGYPILCTRGKQIHQKMAPEDWTKDGKPKR